MYTNNLTDLKTYALITNYQKGKINSDEFKESLIDIIQHNTSNLAEYIENMQIINNDLEITTSKGTKLELEISPNLQFMRDIYTTLSDIKYSSKSQVTTSNLLQKLDVHEHSFDGNGYKNLVNKLINLSDKYSDSINFITFYLISELKLDASRNGKKYSIKEYFNTILEMSIDELSDLIESNLVYNLNTKFFKTYSSKPWLNVEYKLYITIPQVLYINGNKYTTTQKYIVDVFSSDEVVVTPLTDYFILNESTSQVLLGKDEESDTILSKLNKSFTLENDYETFITLQDSLTNELIEYIENKGVIADIFTTYNNEVRDNIENAKLNGYSIFFKNIILSKKDGKDILQFREPNEYVSIKALTVKAPSEMIVTLNGDIFELTLCSSNTQMVFNFSTFDKLITALIYFTRAVTVSTNIYLNMKLIEELMTLPIMETSIKDGIYTDLPLTEKSFNLSESTTIYVNPSNDADEIYFTVSIKDIRTNQVVIHKNISIFDYVQFVEILKDLL